MKKVTKNNFSESTDIIQQAMIENQLAKKKKKEEQEKKLQAQKEFEDNQKQEKHCKVVVAEVLDHYITILFMTLITIYALFFDDLRLLVFTKEQDDIFYGITLFGILCFTVEILSASWA